jgi:hypothetical protein
MEIKNPETYKAKVLATLLGCSIEEARKYKTTGIKPVSKAKKTETPEKGGD